MDFLNTGDELIESDVKPQPATQVPGESLQTKTEKGAVHMKMPYISIAIDCTELVKKIFF